MKNLKITLVCLVLGFNQSSCLFDRFPCKSNNPIFAKYSPKTQEYQTELVRQIERIGSDNLSYWVDGYIKEGDREFITVNMQGSGLCANALVTVEHWTNIEGLRRETSGYHGAKINGFRYSIRRDSLGVKIIYDNAESITD